MELLCEGEELRTAFHDAPAHLDTHGIHEQRQRRQDLGHSPAVLCRTDVDDVEILQLRSLSENPVNRLITYKGPVFLDRVQPKGGRFNSFLHGARERNRLRSNGNSPVTFRGTRWRTLAAAAMPEAPQMASTRASVASWPSPHSKTRAAWGKVALAITMR